MHPLGLKLFGDFPTSFFENPVAGKGDTSSWGRGMMGQCCSTVELRPSAGCAAAHPPSLPTGQLCFCPSQHRSTVSSPLAPWALILKSHFPAHSASLANKEPLCMAPCNPSPLLQTPYSLKKWTQHLETLKRKTLNELIEGTCWQSGQQCVSSVVLCLNFFWAAHSELEIVRKL